MLTHSEVGWIAPEPPQTPQDEANRQVAAGEAGVETPEARRARVQADIDETFEER